MNLEMKTKYVCYCGRVVAKNAKTRHLNSSLHFMRMRQCVLNKNYPVIGKDDS